MPVYPLYSSSHGCLFTGFIFAYRPLMIQAISLLPKKLSQISVVIFIKFQGLKFFKQGEARFFH